MIIPYGKHPLIIEAQMGWEITNTLNDFLDHLISPTAILRFLQVMLSQPEELGKNDIWRS
jgi:hypothetical protein